MTTQRETIEAVNPALLAVGCDPDVMLWRQHVGLFRQYHNPAIIQRIGTEGMADYGGVVKVTITPDMVGKVVGIAIGPEFKTVRGKQREKQADWQAAFCMRGGQYRLIRSGAEMVEFVADVKKGVWV